MAALAISRRRLFAQACAALSAAGLPPARAAQPATAAERPVSAVPSLAALARARGLHFGAAVRPEQLGSEPDLKACALAQCTSLTPEIHLKWDSLEPRPGDYNDAPVEALLDLARDHGQRVRGHTLLWERSTPAWAKSLILQTGRWEIVAGHISRTLRRYAGRIAVWDVVNEPIDTEAGQDGLKRNLFQRAYGSDYVARALTEARRWAPSAELFINDYSFDYDNPVDAARRARFLRLLHDLRSRDVPIDGVGLQAHLDLGKGPLAGRAIAGFLSEIADLGLHIEVTEMDVMEADRRLSLPERDRRVADETRRYLDIVLNSNRVRAVTTWGLSDRHSWLSPDERIAAAEQNRGLPFDVSLDRKPMYDAIAASFRRAI